MVERVWVLCNMGFKSDIVTEDWRIVVTVILYKVKCERMTV